MNNTQWIPVSERLPEPNVDVLICTKCGYVFVAYIGKSNDWTDAVWDLKLIEQYTSKVIAWMELPKAYESEGE